MIRRPPRSTQSRSSAASDVYKRQQLVSRALSRFSQHSRLLKHLDALTCLRRSDSSRQRLPLGLLEDLGHAEIVRAKLKTRTTFQALPDIFLLQYVLKLTSQNTSYHIVRRVICIIPKSNSSGTAERNIFCRSHLSKKLSTLALCMSKPNSSGSSPRASPRSSV